MSDTGNIVRDSLLRISQGAEQAGLPLMKKPFTITPSDLDLVFPDPPEPLSEHRCDHISWDQWMDETAAHTRAYFRNAPRCEPDLSPRERFSLD